MSSEKEIGTVKESQTVFMPGAGDDDEEDSVDNSFFVDENVDAQIDLNEHDDDYPTVMVSQIQNFKNQ